MSDIIDEIAGPEPKPEELESESPSTDPPQESEDAQGVGDAEDAQGEASDKGERVEKMVSLAALQEERGKRQALADELNETRGRMSRMEELFNRFQSERGTLHKPDADGGQDIPKYEDDPDGFYRANIADLQARLDKYEKAEQERAEQNEEHASEQQLMDRYSNDMRAFSRSTPDFQDAYEWLADEMHKDLEARGYADPQEREHILRMEEGQIAGRAMKANKSPAEAVYNYAKARGYKPKEADAENDEALGGEDQLTRLEKGQAAAASLSGGGRTQPRVTSLERLAGLEGAEFDREWEKAQNAGLLG